MNKIFTKRAANLAVISALALGGAAFGINSYAATASANLNVSATVSADCTITGSNLAFGSVSVLSVPAVSTGTVTATCTNGSGYTIALDKGVTGTAVTDRKMISGVDTLDYALFSDAGRTVNWGETTGTDTVAGTGNGAGQALTVYGRIPVQTGAKVGVYADTVIATITF